jgi:large subunit ribosomal protein L1
MPKHSKRYNALKEKIDPIKKYDLEEAISLIKEAGNLKFDSAVEIHVSTSIDVKQSDQQVRGTVSLPHGTGKKQKIAAVTEDADKAKKAGADSAGGEELITEIKAGKMDFDVLVAEPKFMPLLAQVAKILGPRGLMPSPKNGTVAPDVTTAIAELAKGKVAFKNDNTGNIHLMVGRTSFKEDQIKENIESAMDAIKTSRSSSVKGSFIQNITLTSSMGPGIKITM